MEEKKYLAKAYGKVNLSLNVGKTRADGFHEVDMILQQVDKYDEITLTINALENPASPMEISMTSSDSSLPADDSNLCVKAARLMKETFEEKLRGLHLTIHLEKKLPVAAGMAGGSTDAASVMRGIRDLIVPGVTDEALMTLSASIGSDIPFCILGGCARAFGRGELTERIERTADMYLVLVKPSFGVSTPWAYKNYVEEDTENPAADTEKLVQYLEKGDTKAVAASMRNQLQKAVEREHPEIGRILGSLEKAGALGQMMSGSGPTCFGVFGDRETQERAFHIIEEEYPDCFVFMSGVR